MNPNNVTLDGMMAFVEQAKQDPAVLKKQKRVEGTWSFDQGRPQFRASLAYAAGERVLGAEAGRPPDPIQCCLYGLAACFAGTFVSLAAADGVVLQGLQVVAENQVDLTRPMGLGNKPVVEEVSLKLMAQSDADIATLQALERLARERCPGVFCLTQPIPLETSIPRTD